MLLVSEICTCKSFYKFIENNVETIIV